MRTITYEKPFLDHTLKRVFVRSEDFNVDNNVKDSMTSDIERATKSICVVFDNFLNDQFLPLLLRSEASKYLIVPQIDEEKYARISGKVVVHEVSHIKGNYCLIDDKILYLFDPITLVGTKIIDQNIISTVKQLFQKEFWVYTESEFIEKKLPMAEISFDLPPVYSNDKVLIDESFGETTSIQNLFENVDAAAYTKKVDPATNARTIILKDAKMNLDYLKTVDDAKVFLCPQLPFSVLCKNGDRYILNFDSDSYSHSDIVGEGRLFAVKDPNFNFGETYVLEKEKSIEELFGKKVLSVDGEEILIHDRIEEVRAVTVDLRVARELENTDPETQEARLEKIDNNIFQPSKHSRFVTYTIHLNTPKHKLSKPADVYKQYQDAIRILMDKLTELLKFSDEFLDKHDQIQLLRGEKEIPLIKTKNAFADWFKIVNQMVEKLNEELSKTDEEDSKKERKSISMLKTLTIDKDLPKFGILYQEKQRYEYVLSDESDLDSAMHEMECFEIQHRDIAYLLQ